VNVVDRGRLAGAAEALPFTCYKDFGAFGGPLRLADRSIGYVPVLHYRGDRDAWWTRPLLGALWAAGRVPRRPGDTRADLLDAVVLERLLARIEREPRRFPHGTLFLLGVEPGYAPNGDDRTPAQIAADARRVRAGLDALGRGYRLGLGGISTADAPWTRAAYGGSDGLAFLERVLDAAAGAPFDAFTIHPYPSDPAAPSAGDSLQQVRAFRSVLARRGLRERELLVGEIGAPFAAAPPAVVERFAEEVVFALLAARDPALGPAAGGGRLVQRLAWLSVDVPSFAAAGVTDAAALDLSRSALLDAAGRPTAVARAVARGVERAAVAP
jgi:hypothetical protein